MPPRSLFAVLTVLALSQTVANAQARSILANLPQPPVPSDPLEVAATNAVPVEDATQRITAVNVLADARALSNVRAQPYDLKTNFVAFGSSSSDGSWQLEDISPSRGLYRWTAQGPSYSVVNLYSKGMLYSNQSSAIPLRLAQVRSAIFFNHPVAGPRASLRMASGSINGSEVTCVLVTHIPVKGSAGGRRWDESESCVDAKSGVLVTYSPLPGLYILYDYSNAIHFEDKLIPGKFTITQAGQTVIEGHTLSVTDPANLDHSLFEPAGLNPIGVGALMTPAWNVRTTEISPQGDSNEPLGIVILHGMVSPGGHLGDIEVLASSNASLNQKALSEAANWQNWRAEDDQPGATPQSHEVFFTVQFASAPLVS